MPDTVKIDKGVPTGIGSLSANGTSKIFALPQDWSDVKELDVQYNVAGGTLTSILVSEYGSLDGLNWPPNAEATSTQIGGDTLVINQELPFHKIVVTNLVVNTGAPVVSFIARKR